MGENIYSIFIQRGTAKVRLPVNPAKLPVSKEADNGEYNVLGIGPIMVPRTPKLREVTISSWFPGRPLYGTQLWDGFHAPEYYINFFQSAMDERAVVDYIPVRSYENGEPFATTLWADS
jgi:hypothetical protein